MPVTEPTPESRAVTERRPTPEPRAAAAGYLGLTRDNVRVSYRPATPARPDDQSLSVAVVNYQYRFFSPWFSRAFVNPRPVLITEPMAR
jgi:hypothetical protein